MMTELTSLVHRCSWRDPTMPKIPSVAITRNRCGNTASHMTRTFESFLWISLVLAKCCCSAEVSFELCYLILHLCRRVYRTRPEATKVARNQWRRASSRPNVGGDEQGILMSCTLVPLLLLVVPMGQELRPISLAISVALAFLWEDSWLGSLRRIAELGGCSWVLINMLQPTYDWKSIVEATATHGGSVALYLICWWWIGTVPKSQSILGKSVTKGEWIVVSSLLSLVGVHFSRTLRDRDSTTAPNLHSLTAITGVVGCSLSCFVGTKIFRSKQQVLPRLVFVAITTLGFIELCFHVQHSTNDYRFPRCLFWIFGDFLWNVEEQETKMLGVQSDFPRFGWLGYWCVILAVAIPLAPSSTNFSPVIARKWFHLVAVVLFVPTTLVAPQLQSLSYAVALCVLLVIESSRCHLPWLNDFYKCYLDTTKLETENDTVVSHMGLICGCAIPLWIDQWLGEAQRNPMLPLAGVWTLGVGDAVGAVIGSTFGRCKWGQQNRTVEGSMAMFISLCAVMYSWENRLELWLPTALIVTLLEAITLQIDNIVLPLVASMTMIFCAS